MQVLSFAWPVWPMKPFQYFQCSFKFIFVQQFFMFNANKYLAISLSSFLSHIFMTTSDGIMIWNEKFIQQVLGHLTLQLALSSCPVSKHSMWKSCCAQGYDRRDILYVLFYAVFCGIIVVKIYFVCSFTYIIFYLTFCVSWTKRICSLFVDALHCLMAESSDTDKKRNFRIHRLIPWIWNHMQLKCMLNY